MDVQPTELHQKIPYYVGSKNLVDVMQECCHHKTIDAPDDLLEFYRRDNRTTTVLGSLEKAGNKVELRNIVGSALPISFCGILERELESGES